ncbi:uncharacterized protein LOC108674555 [Hyalella azteca]|uniref:Uncharacterized protein LOC108674555 n=1 Tax=Hyalella azteca TaxID=294128 RepID=A0A8B7NYQ0_HYAAZ|nr:uncharacterized protein LOC108674555 [Hyalella azteca]
MTAASVPSAFVTSCVERGLEDGWRSHVAVRGLMAAYGVVQSVYLKSDACYNYVVDGLYMMCPTLPLVVAGVTLGFYWSFGESDQRHKFETRSALMREHRKDEAEKRHKKRVKAMKIRGYPEAAFKKEHRRYLEETHEGIFGY